MALRRFLVATCLTLLIIAAGCKQLDADVSSDGKTLVHSTNTGFVIKSTDNKNLHVVISEPPAAWPKWSHSENELAYFDHKDRLHLYSQPKHVPRKLSWNGLGPIAWSPNDKKLAFVQNTAGIKSIVIIDPVNEKVLAKEPAGADDIADLQWMPDGNRLVVTQGSTVTILGNDFHVLFPFESNMVRCAIVDNSTVVALAVRESEKDPMPHDALIVCDVALGKQTTVAEDVYGSRVPAEIMSDGVLLDRALSPDGKRVGVFALIDSSPVHALRQLLKPNVAKKEQERLEKLMKLSGEVIVFDLQDGNAPPQSFAAKSIVEPNTRMLWSADGHTLVAVTEKDSLVYHL